MNLYIICNKYWAGVGEKEEGDGLLARLKI